MLEIVKRKSQILDEIRMELIAQFKANIAVISHDVTHEIHTITVKLDNQFIGPNVYGGMAVYESTIERHTWPS